MSHAAWQFEEAAASARLDGETINVGPAFKQALDAVMDEHEEVLGRLTDDQPPPTPNDGPIIQELVIADMHARLALGIQRYGTGLQVGNGRDMLRDAYEEALDLAVYLRGLLAERDGAAA